MAKQAETPLSISTAELRGVDELDAVLADCRTLLSIMIDGLDKPIETDNEVPWAADDLHDMLLIIRTRLKDARAARDVWDTVRTGRTSGALQ